MAEKTIAWQTGGGGITVSAPEFKGAQTLTIGATANTGAARTQDIILRAQDDPTKTIISNMEKGHNYQISIA